MDFKFSEEEKLWQWAVSDYAEREIAAQDLMTLNHIPRKILKKMGDLGFLSLRIPEEYGGNPATWVMMGILAEEIAKTSIAFSQRQESPAEANEIHQSECDGSPSA